MKNAGLAAAMFCLAASAGVLFAQEWPERAEGSIHLDVVVTDAAGKPVGGLDRRDFKILDDGKAREAASFAAYDGLHAKADPPVQMILVIDSVNNGFVEMALVREGLMKFLRQHEGRLAQPTTIVHFAASGVEFLSQPSTDGNALAAIVDKIPASLEPRGLDGLSLSMKALSALMKKEAGEPGRKMLIWLGTGWPTPTVTGPVLTRANERNELTQYGVAVQLAKEMEEERIALYGGFKGAEFYMRDYLKPGRKDSEIDSRALGLSVLALNSGGHGELPAINGDSAEAEILNDFVAEAGTFYSLSFDPPRAKRRDEFHELKVEVDKPGLTVRAITGYYNEPEYFRPKQKKQKQIMARQAEEPVVLRPVTVAQLAEIVGRLRSKHDEQAAKEIERLELTERLSSTKLAALGAELPGTRSKNALLAVGDASVFLAPPPDEIPQKAIPEIAEQRQMMSLTVDYLKRIIPRLPDFYANRSTTSFEEIWTPGDKEGLRGPGALHPAGVFKATVYVRGGREVVHADGAEERGLTTRGTFGPILSTAIIDAAHSDSTQWSRWEEGPNGPMAVFRWRVPQTESHYQVAGMGGLGEMSPSAYHGEIGIDPVSGAILRIVLEAEPGLGSSMERADIMVEYGSVAIGGKVYTCPVRSVAYSVGSLKTLEAALGMGLDQEAARLNDVVFNNYHVFRTEMRIVP